MPKFEQEPNKIPKQESEIPEGKGNRPKTEVPEWLLWQEKLSKDEKGKMFARGVKAPDGTYYKLEKGEKFVINKEEDGDYEAIAIGPDGQRVLKESLAGQRARVEQENEEALATARKKIEDLEETPEEKEKRLESERDALEREYAYLKPETESEIKARKERDEQRLEDWRKSDERKRSFSPPPKEETPEQRIVRQWNEVNSGMKNFRMDGLESQAEIRKKIEQGEQRAKYEAMSPAEKEKNMRESREKELW